MIAVNAPKGAPSGMSYAARAVIAETARARAAIAAAIADSEQDDELPGVVLGRRTKRRVRPTKV